MIDETCTTDAAREALARVRLEELQALARTYRNWSVKELAIALGRQPGRLVPESGMPKIDLVVALAKALDWPIEAVVEHLVKPEMVLRIDAAGIDLFGELGAVILNQPDAQNIQVKDHPASTFTRVEAPGSP
jgi:hypothetical protein